MKKLLKNGLIISFSIVLLWLGLLPYHQAIGAENIEKVNHYISRMSFGVTPGQIEKVQNMGIENYLQAQLNPTSIPESPSLKESLGKLDTLSQDSLDLFKSSDKYTIQRQPNRGRDLSEVKKQELRKKRNATRRKAAQQAQQAHLFNSLLSERQLQEVMTNFWFNHFNVFINKKMIRFWIADYENDIRSQALGKFRDLLSVTAHHPAMLVYLDNNLNASPNKKRKGPFKGINENYARELMELHTMGVDGGYTQQDVIALAKILTGWGIDTKGGLGDENNFRFFPQRHDNSDKVFLGQTISGTGIDEGEKALDILASHPKTAQFISYKLAQYFVADEPPKSLVNLLASKFQSSDGDIKVVLDTLFHSPEFNNPKYYDKKFKTPYQYLVSILRASNIQQPNYRRLMGMLAQLSMPIYGCITPDGYKNTQEAWLNPEGMLRRVSFANAIANGGLNKKKPVNKQQLQTTLGNQLSPDTKNAIANSPPRLHSTLILGSPEMMHR